MASESQGTLAGKNVLIMGVANRWSIAYAIGEAMKAQGATLILSYLDERMKKDCEALLADQPNGKMYPCDVSKDEDIDALAESIKSDFGRLDTYIHSVGFAPGDAMKNSFIETTRDGWRIALDISAYSLVAVSARIAPLMTDGGSIQTLTYLGSERVFPAYKVMGVAKAALEASVRYLAWDLGEQWHPGQRDLSRTDQDGGGARHPRLHGHVQAPEREDPAQVRFHGRKGGTGLSDLPGQRCLRRDHRRGDLRRQRLPRDGHVRSGASGQGSGVNTNTWKLETRNWKAMPADRVACECSCADDGWGSGR